MSPVRAAGLLFAALVAAAGAAHAAQSAQRAPAAPAASAAQAAPAASAAQAAPTPPAPILGRPLERRFTHAGEFGRLQPVGMLVAPDGAVLAATALGVLRWDGQRWQRVPLPGYSVARTFGIGADGEVYVGAFDRVGRLVRDDTGAYAFEDLTDVVVRTPSEGPLGNVWSVAGGDDGVYFRAEHALIHLDRHGSVRRWPLGDDVRAMTIVDGAILFRVAGRGLMRFREGVFTPVPGGAAFADESLAAVLDDGEALLLVADSGLYRADGTTVAKIAFDTALAAAWRDFAPYVALRLADGTLLAGSLEGTLLHFRPDGTLVARLWSGGPPIIDLAADQEGGTWVAAESELVRLDLPSRWSRFGPDTGLRGRVSDTTIFAGDLWAASSNGLFRAGAQDGERRFVRDELSPRLEAFALASTPTALIVSHREGVRLRPANGQPDRELFAGGSTYLLHVSRFDPAVAYTLSDDAGLRRLDRTADGWVASGATSFEGMSGCGFGEERADVLWLGDVRGGAQRWTLDAAGGVVERRVFGPTEGLAFDEAGSCVLEFGERIHVLTGDRAYRLDGGRFVVADDPPFTLTALPPQLDASEGPVGAAAISAEGAWFRAKGDTAWVKLALPGGRSPESNSVRVDADGIVRFAGLDGLVQYDPAGYVHVSTPRAVTLRGLLRRQRDGAEARLPLASGAELALEPDATLAFDVGLTSMVPNARVRWRIEGLTDVWSDWSPAGTTLPLVNPGPGDYTLVVEGIDGAGVAATPLRFAFGVAPQWWQTPVAKAATVALALVAVFVMVHAATRLRAGRILAANRRLEDEVAKRTAELAQANRELAESNDELRASREAVVASGRRADLIFKALNEALVGEVLDGHYRIDAKVGAGGFGTVYRATQLPLGSTVAIKVFKPIPGQDAQRSLDRFRAEGLSAFKVNHPNAVRVLDFGISMESVAYLVMEYLEGESLGDVLGGAVFDADTVTALLLPIADALAHAHAADVVHRDVKPSNIVVCRDGDAETVKLIDFGIAKVLDDSTPSELRDLTATGLLMGTPNYMAPERFLGDAYDGRSDVYSLGVIAYEMLAGRRPFPDAGENAVSVVLQRLHERAPPLRGHAPDTPPWLETLVMRMLANAPKDRPTAADVVHTLKSAPTTRSMADVTRELRLAAASAPAAVDAAPARTEAVPTKR